MCGLVGISGDLALQDEGIIKRLLMLDYERGRDSTGFVAVRRPSSVVDALPGGEVKLAKIASHPIDLFDQGAFKTALNGSMSRVFIGHNRAATRGGVNGVNAHPFIFGNIAGAHNGTLDHASTARLEDAAGEKYNVDSMAIFACIDKIGIAETVKLMEEGKDSHTGAWSLVWYDSSDNTLNFLRNKHRPLWYGWAKDFSRLYWASEWRFIEAAVGIGGGDFYIEEKTFNRFWQTDTDLHYKYDVSAIKKGDTAYKPVVKNCKGREPVAVASSGTYHHQNFRQQTWPSQNGGSSAPTTTTSTKTSTTPSRGCDIANKPRVVNLAGDDGNPLAGIYSEKDFAVMSKRGCAWCHKDIKYGDPGITVYDRDDLLLCADHSRHDTQNTGAVRIYLPGRSFDTLV